VRHLATTIVLAAAGLIAATSCAKTPAPATPQLPPAASSTTTSQAADPAKNERGNIIKTLGQEAGFGDPGQEVRFSIDRITVDPPCHKYGTKPESGHTLLLNVRVATGASTENASLVPGVLNSANFAEIGADGVTRPAQYGSCSDTSKQLPNTYGANQKYTGTLELGVSEANGSLVLNLPMANAGGWEWKY
jgi:hypothetical protein